MNPADSLRWLTLLLALWAVCLNAIAQDQPPEDDPNVIQTIRPMPRNMDFIGPSVRAATRGALSRQPNAPPSGPSATQPLKGHPQLSEADLRMLIARRQPIQYNVCSVSIGGGLAGPPVLRGNINNNCPMSNVAIINGAVRGW